MTDRRNTVDKRKEREYDSQMPTTSFGKCESLTRHGAVSMHADVALGVLGATTPSAEKTTAPEAWRCHEYGLAKQM